MLFFFFLWNSGTTADFLLKKETIDYKIIKKAYLK